MRALVVADGEHTAEVCLATLRELRPGLEVERVTDAGSALSRLEAGHCECVLLSYRLGSGGPDLHRAIRARWPDLPVVVADTFVAEGGAERLPAASRAALANALRVALPEAAPGAQGEGAPGPERLASADCVLVASADASVVRAVQRALAEGPGPLVVATDVAEACAAASQCGVLVADAELPGGGIRLLVGRLRAAGARSRVVAVTRLGEADEAAAAKLSPVVASLTKPLLDDAAVREAVHRGVAALHHSIQDEALHQAILSGGIDTLRVGGRYRHFTLAEEHAELVQHLMTTLQDGLLLLDQDASIEFASLRFGEMVGQAFLDLVGQSLAGLLDGPDASALLLALRELPQQGGRLVREARVRTASGGQVPVLVTATRFASAGRPQERFLVVVSDLSSLRRAGRRAELLARLLENAPFEAMLLHDAEGYVMDSNRAARTLFGLDRHALARRRLVELLPGFEVPAEARTEIEGTAQRSDGVQVPVEVSTSPMVPGGPPDRGGMLFLRDVTERRRAEEERSRQARQLERSNQELQEFAYAISHDLQEPLRTITGFSELLASHHARSLDEEARGFLDYILDGARRMREMIQGVLAYSRVENRGRELEPTDLSAVVEDVLSDLGNAVEAASARITVGTLPRVHADPVQLYQLVLNLVSNGIKFGGEAPRIEVEARDGPGDRVTVSVRDHGIGIPPGSEGRVFAMFQRLHARDEYSGSGIGLAVARRIVERHGGRIWVEPVAGGGACFCFTLSRAPEPPPDEKPEAADA